MKAQKLMNNKKIEAVFFDMDRTLLEPRTNEISPASLQAIRNLQKKGILVCPATFRDLCRLPEAPGVKWDGYIMNGGAAIYDEKKQVMADQCLDVRTLKKIARRAAEEGVPVYFEGETRFITDLNEEVKDFLDYYGLYPILVDDYKEQPVSSVTLITSDQQAADRILKGIRKVEAVYGGMKNFDLYPKGVSKATGIARFLQAKGLDENAFVCFGDSNADISMLEQAQIGVAVGWADEKVRKAADYITVSEPGAAIAGTLAALHLIGA